MEKNTQYQSNRFSVQRVEYETATGDRVSKDVVRHPGSVAILPILADGKLCLIRNRRISLDRMLLEVPAGTLEPPEPPLACARRELIEETGYRAGQLVPTLEIYPAPGILDEKMYLFEARDLEPGPPRRELGEEIENEIVTLEDALSMIQSGEICDAKTIIALMRYQQSMTTS